MSEFQRHTHTLQPRTPTRSGEKYTTAQGFTAIKDGIKQAHAAARSEPAQAPLAAGAA